jgi:hypothetical protein
MKTFLLFQYFVEEFLQVIQSKLQFSKDGTNCCLARPAQHMLNVFAIFFQLPGEISMEKQNLTRGHSAVVLTPKFAKTKAKAKSSHISLKQFFYLLTKHF